MGAECIGKSRTNMPSKKHRSISNATSQYTTPSKCVQAKYLHKQLPFLVIRYHVPASYPLYEQFSFPLELALHQEFKYQHIFDIRSQTSGFIDQRRICFNREVFKKELWRLCTVSDRQEWQRRGMKTIVIDGSSFVYLSEEGKGEEKQQGWQLAGHLEYLPQKMLFLTLKLNKNNILDCKTVQYSISDHKDLFELVEKCTSVYSSVKHIETSFIRGFLFYSQQHLSKELQNHFILKMMGIEEASEEISLLIFPAQTKNSSFVPVNQDRNPALTYWELLMKIRASKTSFFHEQFFNKTSMEKPLNHVFFILQILRFLVESIQTHSFKKGQYLNQPKTIYNKKTLLINNFLKVSNEVWQPLIFLGKFYLKYFNFQDIDSLLQKIVQTVILETEIVAQGLFHEYGFEINQKYHPYRNQQYHFIANQQKELKIINKHILAFNSYLITQIMSNIQNLCAFSSKLTKDQIQREQKTLLTRLNECLGKQLDEKQNMMIFRDYLLRIQMLIFYTEFTQNNYLGQLWTSINDQFGVIEYISIETVFVYLVLVADIQTWKKNYVISVQSQDNKKMYLKALEMGFKLFGDPRASKKGKEGIYEAVWFYNFILSYAALFKKSNDKIQANFLCNLAECLRQDLSLPEVDDNGSKEMLFSRDILIQYIPLRKFSGAMIRRSEVWDLEQEISRSNYSENASSSEMKRLNKSNYRVNQWEFGLKSSMMRGALEWGNSKMNPPQIISKLKNVEILAIQSSNYHVVVLTQDGLFGWGENGAHQLGENNEHKQYSFLVPIELFKVSRKNDTFQICCGNEHTALLLNGRLRVWGSSEGGVLGGNNHHFQKVVSGGLHMLGIRDGRLYSWGRGEGGQLGHPFQQLKQIPKEETTLFFFDVPTQVKGIHGRVVKMACGDAHSLVLTEQGKVWVFGFSYQGQLGLGITGESQTFQVFIPTELTFPQGPIDDLWAGPTSSFFKSKKGSLFSCGYNDCLQLGIDRVLKILQKKKYLHRVVDLNKKKMGEEEFSKPRKLDIFGNETGFILVELSCGQNHCLALAEFDGQEKMLVGWGFNKNFQIDFKMGEATAARTLDILQSASIRLLCCGSSFSIAVTGELPMTSREVRELCRQLVHQN